MLSRRSYESAAKLETCQILKEDRLLVCPFSEASVNNTATLLGVSRAAVPKVMTAYTNHGKDVIC